MNNTAFLIFIIIFLLFIIISIMWEKINLKEIVKEYFKNYGGGYYEKGNKLKKKFSTFGFLSLGVFPYALGVLFYFSFQCYIDKIDSNMLLQTNIILLTILCLFCGFNFTLKDKQNNIYSETFSAIIVTILFIIINSLVLLFNNTYGDLEIAHNIINSVFWALEFKIFILFFYILRRIYNLKKEV